MVSVKNWARVGSVPGAVWSCPSSLTQFRLNYPPPFFLNNNPGVVVVSLLRGLLFSGIEWRALEAHLSMFTEDRHDHPREIELKVKGEPSELAQRVKVLAVETWPPEFSP